MTETKITFDQWIKEMEEVQAEIARVKKLNGPEIAENRKIRLANLEREQKKLPLLKLIPLPHKIKDWAQKRIDRELEIQRSLKRRSPDVWKSKILELSGEVRNHVACLVWWDFFGHRTVKRRWPHLDEFVNARYEPVPAKEVILGLYKVGYSPWAAKKRATKAKDVE